MYTAAVITVSDRCSQGKAIDTAGPLVKKMLEQKGYSVAYTRLIADELELIKDTLVELCDECDTALVITVGGTGFSKRDVTPEATLAVADRRAPGVVEAMRYGSLEITNRAMLSRAECAIRGGSLILNLPGSEKAAAENLSFVIDALEHGLLMLRGE